MGGYIDIEVWPRFYRPRSVKSLPGLSVTPFPSSDIAKIGIPGQDFREIRKYVSGDPVKNINWRATARRAEQCVWPLVNEFEREGRKSVLIYLHASQATEVGSNIENGLECGLEAAANLLFHYLERGYRTGIYVCGRPPRYFYPETGRVQFRKALRCLIDLEPGYEAKELLSAVEATRDYVLGYNPLSILITTLDLKSSRVVEASVHRIRQFYSRRRRPSIMVVGIDAYGLIPQDSEYESSTAALMSLQTRPLVRRLRSYGANVVEWHPAVGDFLERILPPGVGKMNGVIWSIVPSSSRINRHRSYGAGFGLLLAALASFGSQCRTGLVPSPLMGEGQDEGDINRSSSRFKITMES